MTTDQLIGWLPLIHEAAGRLRIDKDERRKVQQSLFALNTLLCDPDVSRKADAKLARCYPLGEKEEEEAE